MIKEKKKYPWIDIYIDDSDEGKEIITSTGHKVIGRKMEVITGDCPSCHQFPCKHINLEKREINLDKFNKDIKKT